MVESTSIQTNEVYNYIEAKNWKFLQKSIINLNICVFDKISFVLEVQNVKF